MRSKILQWASCAKYGSENYTSQRGFITFVEWIGFYASAHAKEPLDYSFILFCIAEIDCVLEFYSRGKAQTFNSYLFYERDLMHYRASLENALTGECFSAR